MGRVDRAAEAVRLRDARAGHGMSWWDTIGADGEPRRAAPGRSIYEDRGAAVPTKIVVSATSGRLLGHEIDGKFVKAGPCCDNPARCEREECWTPLPPSLDGFKGVR